MSGTAFVVAGEQGVEGGDAVAVGRLDTAESGPLQHGSIVGITHTGISLHANVRAGGVGAPDVNIGICDGLAGLVVDYLDDQGEGRPDSPSVMSFRTCSPNTSIFGQHAGSSTRNSLVH